MSYKQPHKHFSNKSANTPFGGYFLVIWLNGSFFMLSCSKTSLTGKTGSTENPRLHCKLETRIGDARRAQIIRWDSFVTSSSKTFSWKSTMYNFFKDKLQLAKAVVRRCSVIKSFTKFKEKRLRWCLFISGEFAKKWPQHWRVLGNFTNFLRTLILQNTWERLLLTVDIFLKCLEYFKRFSRIQMNKSFWYILFINKCFWYILFTLRF